jgi:hypothetical protein
VTAPSAPEASSRTPLVIGGAALAAALVVLAAVLLVGRDGEDDVSRPAAAPTATAPSASPSTEPSAEPSSEPSTAPSVGSSPAGSPQAPAVALDGAFLPPERASEAELPGWAVEEGYQPQAGALFDPCADGSTPDAEDAVASDERRMSSEREVGGSTFTQELYGFAHEVKAQAAFDAYRAAAERCPDRGQGRDQQRSTVVPVADDRYLVEQAACPEGDCDRGAYASYVLVARAERALTVAEYGLGEDGKPQDLARRLLDAAADQLRSASS